MTSYSGTSGSVLVNALSMPASNCVVSSSSISQSDGIFHDISPIRFAMIGDGLSQTVFFVEKSIDRLSLLDGTISDYSARHGWYVTGNWGDTIASNMYPPNLSRVVAAAALDAQTYSPSSSHPGGINALFGDGSVRFISDSIQSWAIDPESGDPVGSTRSGPGSWSNLPPFGVWQQLSTRSGQETLSTDQY